MYNIALQHLQQMFGKDATFRDDQWKAIEMVLQGKRTLVVQQTGWGKSIVYFIAAKMLRDAGKGPTIIISPLLALMRNQVESAARLGIKAITINSTLGMEDLERAKDRLFQDACDVLLVSPEQLANRERFDSYLASMRKGIGLFVVDEAHCISDWGHDFRPDYRRIINIINTLPPNVPVLATTATANQRVIDDVSQQLGNIHVLRGPLVRESLQIQSINLEDQAARLAWLAENVPGIPGVGIIYCMTVADCHTVSSWLQANGIKAMAYTGRTEEDERERLEEMFMRNEMKCLVATVALGMGYDKADIGFVIHYQRPGSIVAYYQQIGRAGRKLESAYAILLNGAEDDDIQEYFIKTAFPTETEMNGVIWAIGRSYQGLTQNQIESKVDIKRGRLEKCLSYLEVANMISKDDKGYYFRTVHPWSPDLERSRIITERRYEELEDMRQFVELKGCYMQYIAQKLDDPHAQNCGRCSICTGREFFSTEVQPDVVHRATLFLRSQHLEIKKKKRWPMGVVPDGQSSVIPVQQQLEDGRMLCRYGDAGWGRYLREDKYVHGFFRDELVNAGAEVIREMAQGQTAGMSVVFVPSLSRPELVKSFAQRVAQKLNIPCLEIIRKRKNTKPQKELENSTHQCLNAMEGFVVEGDCRGQSLILIDDMVDSGWTLTVCGTLLKDQGARLVYPFAIASTAGSQEG